ncbi:MAG: YqgE/AlgH family protein [Proteobacteria bacterium]|nr:YqgE/AlgH family protein [Pseudomonadota bacterium]
MSRFSRFLALACCFVCAGVGADQVPTTGKLLVATDAVRGPYFAQTVVLLLHHDETGTLGLVVNRPIDASAIESLRLHEDLAEHRGAFYWGGPLSQSIVRALISTDTPPEDAVQIFDVVHLVNMDEASLATAANAEKFRFFVGYAGWSPGQLEQELVFDSWHILPATEEVVFAEDTGAIWRKLLLSRQYRAAAPVQLPFNKRSARINR